MKPEPSALGWARGPGLGVLLFLGVTAVGTLGYMVIEGWSWWDAFFMTVISVTTAGYGYVHPLTRAGEAWTSVVLIAGVATLFYTASVVMGLVDGRTAPRSRTAAVPAHAR